MDIESLRHLVVFMDEHGLAEVEWETPERKIRLRKAGEMRPVGVMPARLAGRDSERVPAAEAPPAEVPVGSHEIRAPLVGTFYRATKPGADPFVDVGDRVDMETVVCIVEAMKVMNEIKAEVSGVIQEVLVENSEPVEFGQVMFRVKVDTP